LTASGGSLYPARRFVARPWPGLQVQHRESFSGVPRALVDYRMAQIFHRSSNALARITMFGGVVIVVFLGWFLTIFVRSSYSTRETVVIQQPIPFSHDHHTAALGIDCRYCHTSVETSAFAGIPPTATCMNCHKEIWKDTDMLAPVRESFATNEPIQWVRVHDLPDYVYFNHSIHLAKGVGCETCHGRVDQMPLIHKNESLLMEWCVGCHRHPEANLRPREAIVTMGYEPEKPQSELGAELAAAYDVQSLTYCSTCHR
jgi:hypothetical protein